MSFCAAQTVSGSSGGRPSVRPRFLTAAMPSRVLSEMSRREVRDGAEDVEHELASRGRGVEVLLEADKVDAKCVELVHGLEQLLERTAEATEAGDTQAVASVRRSRWASRLSSDASPPAPSSGLLSSFAADSLTIPWSLYTPSAMTHLDS